MEDNKNIITNYLTGPLEISESFIPTMRLRHYYKDIEDAFGATAYKQLMVQQMWQGSNGTQEWRDIEFWDGK